MNDSECVDDIYCKCSEKFYGMNCEIPYKKASPCFSMNCKNNAKCFRYSEDDAYCLCEEGFYGSRCQFEAGQGCGQMKCENGGACVEEGDYAHCSCVLGYFGEMCENELRGKYTRKQ